QPFDLRRPPLLRALLVRLDDTRYRLILVLHHIVCDGWSMGILRHEVTALYDAWRQGRSAQLPELEYQYADYARWQREWLDDARLERLAGYWRQALGPSVPTLCLPTDRPRPPVAKYRGQSIRGTLPAALSASLASFARDENATLFMVLLAAFEVLLARYSGQSEFAVGSPVANRPLPELERLIGFFANSLVFRCNLGGDPTFRELLDRVRGVTLGAFAHQEMPFGKLVDLVGPQRDLNRSPLFQAMFVLQNTPPVQSEAGGLRIVDVDLGVAQGAAFDVTLNVNQSPEGLELLLVYNTELFEEASAQRMLDCYETLLGGILTGPDQPVWKLPLVSAAQRRELERLNQTPRACPEALGVHQLFERQAARTPDAAAVISAGTTITYRELDQRANRLAHHLRRLGAGPGTLVGLCFDRSPELIVSLLGILKAGAAYVPLDPDYPQARLAYMVRDAGVDLLVTHNGLDDPLPTDGIRVIRVERDRASIDAQPAVAPEVKLSPDELAYVIYTSGSTGEPKGVEVPHRGLVNHALDFARRCQLGRGDRVLQYLSPSFDASAEEIYPTLASGAAVVLHPAPGELGTEELLEFTRRQAVNVLHVPAPVWSGITDRVAEDPPLADHLKVVVTGGETLPVPTLRRWVELVGHRVRFLYCYGVTEATITTTIYEPPRCLPPGDQGRVPIGRPIANHRVYVLDDHLQPVPVGVCGELFIGGVGVARGYRNRPELTAEKFVTDPFSDRPGARLYRAGDRARWLPDGNLEFHGRLDCQVKVRGYRVEPGEIEAALCQHEGVRDAVVVARRDQPTRTRLVAYVVPAGGEAVSPKRLRAFLADRLPEHMLPALFVPIRRVPLTPGGKIDRHALPAPDSDRPAGAPPYVAPRTPVQRQLAEIWSALLDVEPVGIHDNFFELGGDSILSLQMVSRATAAGLRLTPKQLFLHQTIAELAEVAGRGPRVQAEQGPISGRVPLLPIQRQWLAGDPPDPHHFNQAVLLELETDVEPEHLVQAMGALVQHHDALRSRFVRSQAGWEQIIAAEEESQLVEIRDLRPLEETQQRDVLRQTAERMQAGLDLARGPLLRCGLFLRGPERPAWLLVVIHHLVVDAVSWRILLEDLQQALAALAAGEPVVLPPKTTSVRCWAEKLTQYAKSDEVAEELDFWLAGQHEDRPPLPRDFQGENLCGTSDTVRWRLGAAETRLLLGDAPQAYRTQISDLLLTALAMAITRWTGGDRLHVDLEGHGREPLFEEVDLSRTVGWFTTLFPLRLVLPPDGGMGGLIKGIKEQLRRVPRNGIGYGLLRWLRGHSEIEERLARGPQAEISFNYLGQFDQLADAGALISASDEPVGPTESPRARRRYVLDVIARVQDGRLQVDWVYSQALHRRETIERLAGWFGDALRGLVEHCLSPDAGGFTPSDFPLADVDDEELSRLSELLQQGDEAEPSSQ
ncbi:MAG TPA: amino acid adenylation domain-containing protein, partial [Planctomycetes bacterium]|nr:amino acid adenylation domain-containing protein [Planctomycetota bacterium]